MDTKSEDSAGSDSLDKSLQKKCVMESSIENSITCNNENGAEEHVECGTDGTIAKTKAQQHSDLKPNATKMVDVPNEIPNCSENGNIIIQNICNSNKSSSTFETKVKQISKNLKETTLAESCANKKSSLEDAAATSSSSCSASNSSASSSTSSSPNFELPSTSRDALTHITSVGAKSKDARPATTMQSSTETDTEVSQTQQEQEQNQDEEEQPAKKVRFNTMKESESSSRLIPKKKKKLKAGTSSEDETTVVDSQTTCSNEDNMETEEETDDENEVFNFDKTMADAEKFLMEHPLTFVRTFDKCSSDERLPNGLLEADQQQPVDEQTSPDEEEDLYAQSQPENNVERILGRQTVCDKTSYLLRYQDRTGIFWETDEFVNTNCPNLLNLYEENLERRHKRLRRYVDHRLNYRQRYTDF